MRQQQNKWQKAIKQSGNVFLTLFAAIAIVGVVGSGSVTLLKGPVANMVSLNKTSLTEMRMEIAAKLIMADAVSNVITDADTLIELPEYAAGTITGGGTIPSTLNVNDIDPWNSQFGYCVWDNGTDFNGKNDAGTGTDDRLNGDGSGAVGNELIALISAGPNRQFETDCYAYQDAAPEGVIKPGGSDDIVVTYTYQDALNTMGDLWRFRSDSAGGESVVALDTNLDLRADVRMLGQLSFGASGAGLVLSPATTCGAAQDGQLFRNEAVTPPSIVYCDGTSFIDVVAGETGGGGGTCTGAPTVYDAIEASTYSSGTSLTHSNYTVTARDDQFLIVAIAIEDDNSSGSDAIVSSATYGGTGLTLHTGAMAASDKYSAIYYLDDPAAGTGDIVVNATGTVEAMQFVAVSVDCLAGAETPGGTNVDNTTSNNTISANVTTQSDGAFIIDAFNNGGNCAPHTPTASGQTLIHDGENSGGGPSSSYASSYAIAAAAGSYFMSYSSDCNNHLSLSVASFEAIDADAANATVSTPGGSGTCTNVGDECGDGTIYAGTSTDGNVDMFTTHCDAGQSWTGASCSGTRSTVTWNEDAAHSDYQTTSATSNDDGDGNTATIITVDADGTVAGVQQHDAAQHCADLTYGGHDDWHLPALNELQELYDNRNDIGNFDTGDDFWSSTEDGTNTTRQIDFASGATVNFATKNGGFKVRCVRLGTLEEANSGAGDANTLNPYNFSYTAYAWGDDTNGKLGNGDSLTGDQDEPYPVTDGTGFIEIHGNQSNTCGIKSDGTAWCWGSDDSGQLGNGAAATTDQSEPVLVSGLSDVVSISTGTNSSFAVTKTGQAYSWGSRVHGMLGDGGVAFGQEDEPVLMPTYSDWIKISGAEVKACGLRQTGEVYCWGRGLEGETGQESLPATTATPYKIGTHSDYVDVDGRGADYACALRANGKINCWGRNTYGEHGNGVTNGSTHIPQEVSNIDNFISVSTGWVHACGLTEDGVAYCWGSDSHGALGCGGCGDSNVPVQVSNITDFVQISAGGSSTCGITSDGTGYCWGRNIDGNLGDESTTNRNIPTEISGNHKFSKLMVPYNFNNYFTLGIVQNTMAGEETAPITPYEIKQGHASGDTSDSHGLAIELDSSSSTNKAGIAFAIDATSITTSDIAGAAIIGQRATGDSGHLMLKTMNSGGTALETGLIINSEGRAATTNLISGLVGALQTESHSTTWGADYYSGLLVTDQAAGTDQIGWFGVNESTGAASILFSKDFYISGANDTGSSVVDVAYFIAGSPVEIYGELAQETEDGTITIGAYSSTATDMASLRLDRFGGTSASPSAAPSNATIGTVKFRGHDGTDIDEDGQAQIMAEIDGSVGAGTVPTDLKVKTAPNGTMNDAATALEIESDGRVFVGDGDADSLLHVDGRGAANEGAQPSDDTDCSGAGDAGTIRYNSGNLEVCDGSDWNPIDGGGSSLSCDHQGRFIDVASGQEFSCGLYDNGQVACWGNNIDDNIGIDTAAANVLTPHIISSSLIKDAVAIEVNRSTDKKAGYVITKGGRVFSWGDSLYGIRALGINVANTEPTPRPAIGLPNKIKKISVGFEEACTIDEYGQVQCWGRQTNSEFGNIGGGLNVTAPVYSQNMPDAIDVSTGIVHTCAVRKDNTAWCWGDNAEGQLGDGSTTTSGIPVEVTGLTDVIDVAVGIDGAAEFSCAVRRNGEVWCWGNDDNGQLGNGGTTTGDQSSPVQVTGITSAVAVSAGTRHVCALLEDGTVQCWGSDADDAIGNAGAASNQTSPLAVTNLSNAVKIDVGHRHGCAVTEEGQIKCWGSDNNGEAGTGSVNSGDWQEAVDSLNPLACDADKFVFVTAGDLDGNLGGVEGADAICQASAEAAELHGTYYAWLGTTDTDPASRFNQSHGAYYLPDGTTKIADDWADLTDGTLDNAINQDQDGNTINVRAWTSVDTDGTALTADNCADWTIDNTLEGYYGTSNQTNSTWTNDFTQSCSTLSHLYCFQQ